MPDNFQPKRPFFYIFFILLASFIKIIDEKKIRQELLPDLLILLGRIISYDQLVGLLPMTNLPTQPVWKGGSCHLC
jgi:hypothetical protein